MEDESAMRWRALLDREASADARDRAADRREVEADLRDVAADRRERIANLREARADEREAALDAIAHRLGLDVSGALERAERTLDRQEEALERSRERLARSRAELRRLRVRAVHEQDEVDHEVAVSAWSALEGGPGTPASP